MSNRNREPSYPIDSPDYDTACAATCEIVNLLGKDYPGGRAQLFGRVLFRVLAAIYAAKGVSTEGWFEPSEN